MAMNCAIVKEWMPHYIEASLPTEMERRIRLHIQFCPDCAQWLEEAKEISNLWSEMDSNKDQLTPFEFPDLTAEVIAQIDELETGRRERISKATAVRQRYNPRTSWMHYTVAACLSFLLLQFGVFEDLAHDITEINGHMSNSVTRWFGSFGDK